MAKRIAQVTEGLLMIILGEVSALCLAPLIAGTSRPVFWGLSAIACAGISGALMRDYWTRWRVL